MEDSKPPLTRRQLVIFITLCLLSLGPWLALQFNTAANSDILWLTMVLGRVLHGGAMSRVAYEPNPPFNMLTCLLPWLLSQAGIKLATAIILSGLLWVSLAAVASARILKGWDIDRRQALLIAASFVIAATIFTSNTNFGERDHLIGLALFPFTLLQLTLTYRFPWPRITGWIVLGVGAFVLLLKPHYGLLPVVLLAHRAAVRRSWRVIHDPDFLCLAAASILCPLLTWLIFPDWVAQILPAVIDLYLPLRAGTLAGQTLKLAALGAAAVLVLWRLQPPSTERRLSIWLGVAAIINLAPYYVQGKDYYYHLLPAIGFFVPAVAMATYRRLQKEAGPVVGWFLALFAVAGLAYGVVPPNRKYPTHTVYANFPLTKIVADCGGLGHPCPFFMFNDGMGITMETAYYADATYTSRFPSFWFLPKVAKTGDGALPPAIRDSYRGNYSKMVAEDFVKNKPQLVLLGKFDVDGQPFDFVKYFSADPSFATAWHPYKWQRRVTIDRKPYDMDDGSDETVFDIYRREPD